METVLAVAETTESTKPLWESTDLWLVILTAVLAVATVALWLATRALVKGSDRSAQRQQRAYLAIEEARLVPLVVGEYVKCEFRVRNAGQTPARFVSGWAMGAFGTPDHSSFPTRTEPHSNLVVAPGQSAPVMLGWDKNTHVLTQQLIDDVHSGKAMLFLWGRLTYVDVFGQPHFTNFRYFHGKHPMFAYDPTKTNRLLDGNDAD